MNGNDPYVEYGTSSQARFAVTPIEGVKPGCILVSDELGNPRWVIMSKPKFFKSKVMRLKTFIRKVWDK